jgi:hypothetical protein
VQHDTYTTTHKGRRITHYRIAGLYQPEGASSGQLLVDDVSAETYASLAVGRAEAPFIVVPGVPEIHQVGYLPTIHEAAGILLPFGAVMSLFLFYMTWKNSVPWYEQELVVEQGSGKLYP